MQRIVLITDIDTPLGYALLKPYIKENEKVIGTVSSGKSDTLVKDLDKNLIDIIQWQRTSPIDTKNLILTIIKKYKKLDEALIIQSIQSAALKLHETPVTEIDKSIDSLLKGLFFLCREIIKTYLSRQAGILLFINYLNTPQGPSPISEAIKNGIDGFIGQLFRSYQKERFILNSIESSYVDADILSAFIYKNIKERLRQSSGKRLRFQQKIGLFSGLKKAGKK